LDLVGTIKAAIAWLGGAIAGLTVLCYGAGYLAMHAHMAMLGEDTMRIWVREGEVRQLVPPFETITGGTRGDLIGGRIVNRTTIAPRDFESRFPPLPPMNPVIL
jgi:hypothetical protein